MINLNKKDSVADSIKSIIQREEIDPEKRTKDMLAGRAKSNQKDDVGPAADGKPTKVKYHPGPKNEDVEQIDELSKSTLGSYAKKGTKDARMKMAIGKDFERIGKASRKPEYKAGAKEWEDKYKSDARRREGGVMKAIDRLTKEEVDLQEANNREYASQGKMHPDMAKHMNVGQHMDYYEPKTGNKVHGKVMHKSDTEIHMKQTHDSYNPKKVGSVHKFKIGTALPEEVQIDEANTHKFTGSVNGKEWHLPYNDSHETPDELSAKSIHHRLYSPHHELSHDEKNAVVHHFHEVDSDETESEHNGHKVHVNNEVQKIREETAPTVKTAKYTWGTMKTVHHGSHFSIPLHPEHHQAIAKLKDGQEHHFKDETGKRWGAYRRGENVHFQSADQSGAYKTHVPHASMHESTKPPFAKPYKTVIGNIKDKSGAVHTPMSRARDLARKARDKMEDNAKNSETEVVKEALKGNQKKLDKNHNGKLDADDFKKLRNEDTCQVCHKNPCECDSMKENTKYAGLEKEPKMGLKTAVIKKSKNAVESDTVEGWDHPHDAVKKESFDDEGNLVEAMISYSDFHAKMAAHKAAGNRIVDYKHNDKKAHYTVVDKEGTARKITHTDRGTSMENLGPHKSDEHGNDDKESGKKSEPGVKRGRGRPAGSKSGANQKVTTGKHSGVDYTGYKLHLPNRNN